MLTLKWKHMALVAVCRRCHEKRLSLADLIARSGETTATEVRRALLYSSGGVAALTFTRCRASPHTFYPKPRMGIGPASETPVLDGLPPRPAVPLKFVTTAIQ
jgi:hypothetical protein